MMLHFQRYWRERPCVALRIAGACTLCALLCLALCLQACRKAESSLDPAAGSAAKQGKAEPYSAGPGEMLDAIVLLGEPPAESSPGFAYDEAMYQEGLRLRATPRGEMAVRDAGMRDFNAMFGEAFGLPLSTKGTPETWRLLHRLSKEGGVLCRQAKKRYHRTRPFVRHGDPSCYPLLDDKIRSDGSYPSGHAMRGWSFALVLAELNPARKEVILKRGWEFGQSRVVCGCHWQSDVDASRKLAAGMVAALHSNPEFIRQMARAKAETARLLQGGK